MRLIGSPAPLFRAVCLPVVSLLDRVRRVLALADISKAKRYERTKLIADIAISAAETGCLVALVATGWSVALRNLLEPLSAGLQSLLIVLYIVALGAADEVLFFWARWWRGYRLEKIYGLSVETFRGWLWDYVKGKALAGLLLLLILEIIFALMRWWPRAWWILAGIVICGIMILLAQLVPVILLPLFYKSKELENADLRQRLAALAARAGVRLDRIDEVSISAKTNAVNAALAGLGRTRRILLADTLLAHFSNDEVETVIAHEMGHHVGGHLRLRVAMQSAAIFLFLGLIHITLSAFAPRLGYTSIADPAVIPLMGLVSSLVTVLILPPINTMLRAMERKADRYAIEATGKPWAFIAAIERLARRNVADPQPNALLEVLFRSHPSTSRRIASCRRWAAELGLSLAPPMAAEPTGPLDHDYAAHTKPIIGTAFQSSDGLDPLE